MPLVAELKRRNVFKVATAYLALGWVIVQVTATVVPYMRLPEWTVPMVLWVGLIGFPCVLIFSWLYELTPEGIKRESEIDRDRSITPQTGRKLDFLIVGLLVAAIGLFVWSLFRASPTPVDGMTENSQAEARQEADVGLKPDLQPNVIPAEAGTQQASAAAAPAPDDKSIAVLPFADMSAAKDQEYMSDGISEELLNLLAKIPELRVIARTSSFAYKGTNTKVAEVARELNVANVLEGSVRTAGNRVRITAQLVRAADSSHLWSETYDRTLDDIFAVQDEIAAAVVSQLKIKLLGNAPTSRQANPAAYALLLQARQLSRAAVAGTTGQMEELLKQALAIDPGYADAWAELGGLYHGEGNFGTRPLEEGLRLGREANRKALELDPKLALALADLAAMTQETTNDLPAVAALLAHAVELEPTNPLVLGSAADFLRNLGRVDGAIAIVRYTLERDPVNPGRQQALGYANLYSGKLDEALESFHAALALSPGRVGTHYFCGVTLLLKGESEAAMQEFQQESAQIWHRFGLALGQYATGHRAEADAALAELIGKDAAGAAYNIAYIHAYRNEADRAFEWLDKAVETRDPGLSDVLVDPLLANLHADPRWPVFLRKLGRAPEQLAAIEFDVKLP